VNLQTCEPPWGGYGDLVSQRRSNASTFYHFDAIGSTRFLTAEDESVPISYVYDAFGGGRR